MPLRTLSYTKIKFIYSFYIKIKNTKDNIIFNDYPHHALITLIYTDKIFTNKQNIKDECKVLSIDYTDLNRLFVLQIISIPSFNVEKLVVCTCYDNFQYICLIADR